MQSGESATRLGSVTERSAMGVKSNGMDMGQVPVAVTDEEFQFPARWRQALLEARSLRSLPGSRVDQPAK
jgi:hypothetical protein